MAQDTIDFAELMKMSDQVASDDGPGSAGWNEQGTVTQKVNETVMAELRANGGKMSGELSALPFIIITTTGAKSG